MENPTLLQRIAGGDSAAVSDFIDRYGGLIWSLARRFTSTNADAEDAVQEIFFDLWKSCKNFRPEIASEKTFTAMVARRRLIDRKRKKSMARVEGEEVERLSTLAATAPQQAEMSEEAAKASRLLDALPTEQSQSIKFGSV